MGDLRLSSRVASGRQAELIRFLRAALETGHSATTVGPFGGVDEDASDRKRRRAGDRWLQGSDLERRASVFEKNARSDATVAASRPYRDPSRTIRPYRPLEVMSAMV